MANKRSTGLDIARTIAMQSVVVLHLLGQGGIIENSTQWTFKYWMLISIVKAYVEVAGDLCLFPFRVLVLHGGKGQ